MKIITNRRQESILDLTDYKSADFILPDNFDIGNFEKYIKFAAIKSSSNVARAGRKIGFTRLGVWLNEQKQQVIRYLKKEIKDNKFLLEYKNDLDKLTERNKDKQLILKGKHLVYILEKYSYKEFQVDENAETLEDKLRDEHRPIPEEREDSNLFETMAEKFRPKQEEEWDKDDGKGPIRYNTFKQMTDKFTEKMEDINGPEAYDSYHEFEDE